jgi:hypothetical protein
MAPALKAPRPFTMSTAAPPRTSRGPCAAEISGLDGLAQPDANTSSYGQWFHIGARCASRRVRCSMEACACLCIHRPETIAACVYTPSWRHRCWQDGAASTKTKTATITFAVLGVSGMLAVCRCDNVRRSCSQWRVRDANESHRYAPAIASMKTVPA